MPSSTSSVPSKQAFTFQEIPLGTITEALLTGNSSVKNKLPCYEYEHNTYDSDGNIIIGNTVDRNGDGKIDEKDVLLDKDAFYCVKLLDDAIKEKTEIQLNSLIKQLDGLMKTGCSCNNVYSGSFPPDPYARIDYSGGDCSCPYCTSYCRVCGYAHTGCPQAPDNTLTDSVLKQYNYDACGNRQQIDCKKEEIKQLIDGTAPETICYLKGWIDPSAPKSPALLTFETAIARLQAYKDYFTSQVAELKKAEGLMKGSYGERISLAEINDVENSDNNINVQIAALDGYDISRYCKQYDCSLSNSTKSLGSNNLCTSGEFNNSGNICKSQQYYLYDGDGATFYFSAPYDQYKASNTIQVQQGDKCSVTEQDLSKGYTGVVPIGEVVDDSEIWGNEVANRMQGLIGEAQSISSDALAIYDVPDSCNSGNCRNAASNCCTQPYCGDCGDGDCCCPTVSYVTCYPAVPNASLYADYDHYISGRPVMMPYVGCSSSCSGDMPDVVQPEAQYWACPYGSFCQTVEDIYKTRIIDDSCYEPTADSTEQPKRVANLQQVGHLQKFEAREGELFELDNVDNMASGFADVSTDSIVTVCPNYLINPDNKSLKCDSSLSDNPNIKNRFTLLSMLTLSRERLTGCITGYSWPYKGDLTEARVFSCEEGIDLMTSSTNKLTILSSQSNPYPYITGTNYYNCYPLNSPYLNASQQKACLVNKDKYSTTGADPGCQNYISDYMDNYYCCE